MNLPAAVFQAALAEVEHAMPGLLREGGNGALAHELWTNALREECRRRGWVQKDEKDVGSWEFVGASSNVPGHETLPSGSPNR